MRIFAVFVLVSILFAGSVDQGDAAPGSGPTASSGEGPSREELEEELEEFVPSEELPSDSAISFPVDI